jgi:hypothetical protein
MVTELLHVGFSHFIHLREVRLVTRYGTHHFEVSAAQRNPPFLTYLHQA